MPSIYSRGLSGAAIGTPRFGHFTIGVVFMVGIRSLRFLLNFGRINSALTLVLENISLRNGILNRSGCFVTNSDDTSVSGHRSRNDSQ